MDDDRFGIYLYGSEAKGTATDISDLDLVVFGFEQWSGQDKKQVLKKLFAKFPKWSKKTLDACFVLLPDIKPRKAVEMAALCWLQHNKQTLALGSDIISEAYQTNWDDYLITQEQIVQNWYKKSNDVDASLLYQQCLKLGNTKPLFNICFSMALYECLLSQSTVWIFNIEEIKSPLLNEACALLREKWNYKTPRNETDLFRLKTLCQKIQAYSLTLKKNPGHFKQTQGF